MNSSMQQLVDEGIVYPFTATRVANTITYADNDAHSDALDFHTQNPTRLAYQLSLGLNSQFDATAYMRPAHARTAILTNNAKILRRGKMYNYLDCKGIGYMDARMNDCSDPRFLNTTWRFFASASRAIEGVDSSFTYGGACLDEAEEERKSFQKVEDFGARTAPIIAEASLHEVLNAEGKKISINEAKEKGILAAKINPGLIYRAWVTPYRAVDIYHQPNDETLPNLTAFEIQAKRNTVYTAIDDIYRANHNTYGFSTMDDYVRWFVKATAREIAVLHRNHTGHGNLLPHNITLDGRLVDYDSTEINTQPSNIALERDGFFKPDGHFFNETISTFNHLRLSRVHPEAMLELALKEYQSCMQGV